MKLSRSILGVLASLSLVMSASSQAESASTSVWKVSKGEDTIYLGGTIHILPISEFPLPDAFTEAYKKSDSIVLEADLPEPTDTAAQMAMLKTLTYEAGQTLSGTLSPSTYQALADYLKSLNVNVKELDTFRPGFIAVTITAIEAQRAGIAGQGVDAYFDQLAAKDNKPKEYLETMAFQLALLARQGEGYEDEFIETNIEQMSDFKTMINDLISAWREGDTQHIDRLIIQDLKKQSPESFEEFFVARNKNWIPKIEAMFGDQDTEFVLVGAGHLAGEESVIDLLKKKGYTISQL